LTFLEFYIHLAQASSFLLTIIGLCFLRKTNLSFLILLSFFLVSFLFEFVAFFLAKKYHNNLPGLHIYTVIELLAFSYFFFYNSKRKFYFKIILLNTILYLAVALADATFINTIWKFNTYSRTYASASLVIYSLIYFYTLMESDEIINLWQSPIFWINIGVLFYFATNLFFFMLSNYISSTDVKLIPIGLYFHSTINIIANCIFAYSYFCIRKNKI
jgi:hypothetical protein